FYRRLSPVRYRLTAGSQFRFLCALAKHRNQTREPPQKACSECHQKARTCSSTELYRVFLRVGVAASVADYLPQREAEIDPSLVNVARAGMLLSALDYARAQRERHRFYDRVRRFFAQYD